MRRTRSSTHAAERFTKNLTGVRGSGERPMLVAVKDEADQARYVAEHVLACREQGMLLKSQAVLFRTSSHSAPLELELARRNIPFVKYGGLKFLDAAHVKDVLCVLRWAHNARDRLAGFRVAAAVARHRPGERARACSTRSSAPATDAPRFTAPRCPRLRGALAGVSSRCSNACATPQARWPAEVDDVLAWYEPHLARIHEDGPRARSTSPRSSRIAATYPSRERFLTEITLDPPSATAGNGGAAAHRRRLPRCCRPSTPRRARSGRACTS